MLLTKPHALQPTILPIRNRSQGVLLGVSALLTPRPEARHPRPPARGDTPPPGLDRSSSHPLVYSRSGRMPCESLDAPKDLPKEDLCQVAFSKLEDEVSGMPDEAPAGLE